ncbi:hypothetical protein BP6252_03525 [Coleophoma cylindrospora]|uniref:Uncharacterized protein n=1 Tax=Coleophoma cylindrospora TaxID=1849047 RepID=A0A3D8S7X5_9HELO|nr:hypothetical protein BP6252_03525 [Coleophoma cylindrospora]
MIQYIRSGQLAMKRARKQPPESPSHIPSPVIYAFDGFVKDYQEHLAHSACVMPAPKSLRSQYGVVYGNANSIWMQKSMDFYLDHMNDWNTQEFWETGGIAKAIEKDDRTSGSVGVEDGIAQMRLYTSTLYLKDVLLTISAENWSGSEAKSNLHTASTLEAEESSANGPVAYDDQTAATATMNSPQARAAPHAQTTSFNAVNRRVKAPRRNAKIQRKNEPFTVKNKDARKARMTSNDTLPTVFDAPTRPTLDSKLRDVELLGSLEESGDDEKLTSGAMLLRGKVSHKFSKAIIGVTVQDLKDAAMNSAAYWREEIARLTESLSLEAQEAIRRTPPMTQATPASPRSVESAQSSSRSSTPRSPTDPRINESQVNLGRRRDKAVAVFEDPPSPPPSPSPRASYSHPVQQQDEPNAHHYGPYVRAEVLEQIRNNGGALALPMTGDPPAPNTFVQVGFSSLQERRRFWEQFEGWDPEPEVGVREPLGEISVVSDMNVDLMDADAESESESESGDEREYFVVEEPVGDGDLLI